ncbi:MAG: outer membrane protein assembly factor BamC [Amphritea sp.]
MRIITLLPLAAAVLSVAGCGSISNPLYGEQGIINDRSQNYEKSETSARLEIPPHLQATAKPMEDRLNIPSAGQTASTRTREFEVPRPEFFYADVGSESVNLKREKGDKILIVDEPIADVWVQLQDFWHFNGVELAKSAPQQGVMETAWIDADAKEYSFIDSLVKRMTFQDIEGPVSDKLQINVRPLEDDYQRTAISMKHLRVPQDERPASVDWQATAEDVGYKSDMMFEMLRYLSKASTKETSQSLLALKESQKARPQLGRDSQGFPALKITAPVDQAWSQLNSALDRSDLDVGTRDQNAGIFYMTHTTATSFAETEKMGFFEWLHSDREDIKLNTSGLGKALGFSDEEADSEVSYSSKQLSEVNPQAAPSDPANTEYSADMQDDPANEEGYKIWLGGKVIYTFGGDQEGTFNAETNVYEHTGQYQLVLNRTSSGVFMTVKTPDGYSAPAVIAEEILWEIKENI